MDRARPSYRSDRIRLFATTNSGPARVSRGRRSVAREIILAPSNFRASASTRTTQTRFRHFDYAVRRGAFPTCDLQRTSRYGNTFPRANRYAKMIAATRCGSSDTRSRAILTSTGEKMRRAWKDRAARTRRASADGGIEVAADRATPESPSGKF